MVTRGWPTKSAARGEPHGRKRDNSNRMEQEKKNGSPPLDPVCRRLLQPLAPKGSTLRTASIAMGRSDAYLQQFGHRGTPETLAGDDRETLTEHLECRPERVKHGRSYRLSTHIRQPPPCDPYAGPQAILVRR